MSVLDSVATLLDAASSFYLCHCLHQQRTATATSDKTDVRCRTFSTKITATLFTLHSVTPEPVLALELLLIVVNRTEITGEKLKGDSSPLR